jgi:putative Mn2+ efflux pump MntP
MNAVDTALYSTLAAGTALTTLLGGTAIYNGQIPRDKTLPAVVFSLASGVEDNMTPVRTNRLIYNVQGVATSLNAAGALADAIDDLLHGVELSIVGYGNFWTARETVIAYQELDPAGHIIGHAGGEYAIRVDRELWAVILSETGSELIDELGAEMFVE